MKGFAGAVLVCTAVLAAGCGGTGSAGVGASNLVPATAPAYIAIDTDPGSSQWKTVNDLAGRFPDKQKAVDAAKKELRKQPGLDWDRDIKPAFGPEVDVVWLDFAHGGTDVVVLTQPRDDKKFAELVRKADAGDTSTTVVLDKYKDWTVLADSQAKIDRFEQESSSANTTLSDVSSFQHAMKTLGGDSIVRGYLNGTTVMNLIRQDAPPDATKFVNKLGTLDWFALRLGAQSDGIGLDAIVHGTPGQYLKSSSRSGSFRPTLTKSLPRDALLYYTFHGTQDMFGGLAPTLGVLGVKGLTTVFRRVGKILQGEDALYVREPATGHIPEITFVAAPGPGVDGAASLDRLATRFRKELGAQPKRTSIAGTQSRTLAMGPVSIHYANVHGKLVVTDLAQGIRGVQNPGAPLSQSATFNDAKQASGMPDKTTGFLYVNIHSTIPAVERLAQIHAAPKEIRDLKPLRSAIEYGVARSHEVEVSFFVRIK